MRVLALDLGGKKTGVAWFDEVVGFPMPLSTLEAEGDALVERIVALVADRQADQLVIGLPYLPSGIEGAQAAAVRRVIDSLPSGSPPVTFIDERYTSPRGKKAGHSDAALSLLQAFLDQRE